MFIFVFCYACNGTDKTITDNDTIEDVKKQFLFFEWDSIRPPDSIHVIKLELEGLYLRQSFYGTGYGNGILINLVEKKENEFNILDEILCYWEDYLFTPKKIEYDNNNDWFIYIDEGSGTGHYSEHTHIVRVFNNKLIELFHFPNYSSDILIEMDIQPQVWVSIKTNIDEANKKRIILNSVYEVGIINDKDESVANKQIKDKSVFLFYDSCNCFIWQKSSNPKFEKVWKETDTYPE